MHDAIRYILDKFEQVDIERRATRKTRRIGLELKFPLVDIDGFAGSFSKTKNLWQFLMLKGWKPISDEHSGCIIGVKKPGEMNDNIATCETGYCKIEFSLAHEGDLMDMHRCISDLRILLREFGSQNGVAFLGYGIQPLTSPGKHLLMKKSRNIFWNRLFGGNRVIPPENGTDVDLFTVSASNQVHVDVTLNEAIDAVNVFNGFAGAQIALTANSNIWKGMIDPYYKSAGEIFWDWWLPRHPGRFGVPERKFSNLEEYFSYIFDFQPVYVRRGKDIFGLPYCPTFSAYYNCVTNGNVCRRYTEMNRCCGITPDGSPVEIEPEEDDINLHLTFSWHNARISRYFTLENRVNDQQPPDEMMVIPALTLGVIENLDSAVQLINHYSWGDLREFRIQAARDGLQASVKGLPISGLCQKMFEIARKGLKKRGYGEEIFLEPLGERLKKRYCPADKAAKVFEAKGVKGFIGEFKL